MKVADAAAAQGDALISSIGLGSCVAIVLYDKVALVGGIAHVLLPSDSMARDRSNRAKFPATAVPFLLERMRELGALDRRVEGRLVGGASMFTSLIPAGGLQIGERNLAASRLALVSARIPLLAEDAGGGHGRSVFLHTINGRLEVRSVAKGNVDL